MEGTHWQGLQTTLFERVHSLYGAAAACLLTVQYRMHADIMNWASVEMYGGALSAHASVAQHLLQDLEVGASQLLATISPQRGDSWHTWNSRNLCMSAPCPSLQSNASTSSAHSGGDSIMLWLHDV